MNKIKDIKNIERIIKIILLFVSPWIRISEILLSSKNFLGSLKLFLLFNLLLYLSSFWMKRNKEKSKKLLVAVGEGFEGVYSHLQGKTLLSSSQNGLESKKAKRIISLIIYFEIKII